MSHARPVQVGRSDRTPAKHSLMNKIFGREISVLGTPKLAAHVVGAHWIDLTAGDGVATDDRAVDDSDNFTDPAPNHKAWQKSCSPGILAHHARFHRYRGLVRVDLCEKQPGTYATLLGNLSTYLPHLDYVQKDEDFWTAREGLTELRVHNRDSMEITGVTSPDNWAVQVVNDPNKVSEWAMNPGLMRNIAGGNRWTCLGMSTMGCNVGGLKRLSEEERAVWWRHVQSQIDGMRAQHDLLLAAIDRDSDQWAYLITSPRCWRDEVESNADKAFGQAGFVLNKAWLRDGDGRFEDICKYLFKTKKELGA